MLLTRPCRNDLFLVSDYPHDYTEFMALKLQQWGAENPQEAARLHDLAVRQHNYPAFWNAVEGLTAIESADVEENTTDLPPER